MHLSSSVPPGLTLALFSPTKISSSLHVGCPVDVSVVYALSCSIAEVPPVNIVTCILYPCNDIGS